MTDDLSKYEVLRKWAQDNHEMLARARENNEGRKTLGLPPSVAFLQYPDIFKLLDCADAIGELVAMVRASRKAQQWQLDQTGEWITRTKAAEAENAKLREALKAVEEWWLAEGMKQFNGAPAAIFKVRAALGKE
jgi:hypothetical protein